MKISGNVYCAVSGKDFYISLDCVNGVKFMEFKKLEEDRSAFVNELTEEEFKIFRQNSKIMKELQSEGDAIEFDIIGWLE